MKITKSKKKTKKFKLNFLKIMKFIKKILNKNLTYLEKQKLTQIYKYQLYRNNKKMKKWLLIQIRKDKINK